MNVKYIYRFRVVFGFKTILLFLICQETLGLRYRAILFYEILVIPSQQTGGFLLASVFVAVYFHKKINSTFTIFYCDH